MLTINLKSRFRNKTFLLAMIGAIVLLIQQLGFKDIIPSNYADIVNSILTILTMVGIVVDTSTKGISDQVVSTTTVQAVNSKEEVKTESGTTSINSTVTENSQSGSNDAGSSSSDKESETDTNNQLVVDAEKEQLKVENEQLKATNAQLQSTVATIQSAVSGTAQA